jgi:UMF1 family MFS transporter
MRIAALSMTLFFGAGLILIRFLKVKMRKDRETL